MTAITKSLTILSKLYQQQAANGFKNHNKFNIPVKELAPEAVIHYLTISNKKVYKESQLLLKSGLKGNTQKCGNAIAIFFNQLSGLEQHLQESYYTQLKSSYHTLWAVNNIFQHSENISEILPIINSQNFINALAVRFDTFSPEVQQQLAEHPLMSPQTADLLLNKMSDYIKTERIKNLLKYKSGQMDSSDKLQAWINEDGDALYKKTESLTPSEKQTSFQADHVSRSEDNNTMDSSSELEDIKRDSLNTHLKMNAAGNDVINKPFTKEIKSTVSTKSKNKSSTMDELINANLLEGPALDIELKSGFCKTLKSYFISFLDKLKSIYGRFKPAGNTYIRYDDLPSTPDHENNLSSPSDIPHEEGPYSISASGFATGLTRETISMNDSEAEIQVGPELVYEGFADVHDVY